MPASMPAPLESQKITNMENQMVPDRIPHKRLTVTTMAHVLSAYIVINTVAIVSTHVTNQTIQHGCSALRINDVSKMKLTVGQTDGPAVGRSDGRTVGRTVERFPKARLRFLLGASALIGRTIWDF